MLTDVHKERSDQPAPSRRFSWKRLLILLLGAYALLSILIYFGADRLIFLPPTPTYSATDRITFIHTERGERIATRFLAAGEADHVILYCHGNAEDLGLIEEPILLLRLAGLAVLALDYPGYGLSDGSPSPASCQRAVDAAYDHLINERGFRPDRIVALGRSVGSGPAVDLATRRQLGALILENPFLSAFRVVTPVPLFPGDRFDNLAKIDQVTCPLLIINSALDQVVPPRHGRILHQRAGSAIARRRVIEDAGHNDLTLRLGQGYGALIADFLDGLSEGEGEGEGVSSTHPYCPYQASPAKATCAASTLVWICNKRWSWTQRMAWSVLSLRRQMAK